MWPLVLPNSRFLNQRALSPTNLIFSNHCFTKRGGKAMIECFHALNVKMTTLDHKIIVTDWDDPER